MNKAQNTKIVKRSEAAPTVARRTGTKRERAEKIFLKYVSKGRQHVLMRFQRDVDLTPAGSVTYFQSLRVAHPELF